MSQQPFGDIPLFRELQKLLSADHGPVNLEIARQVAASTSQQAGADPRPSPEWSSSYARAVGDAHQMLSGYTRLASDEPPGSSALSRSAWIESTLQGWSWLMEDFAGRFIDMAKETAGEQAGGIEAVMGQIVPLLMGLQVGTLVGHLSTEVLYRYELPIPRDDDNKLFVVPSNAEKVISDYSFNTDGFTTWVALRDTCRHLILGSPWVGPYFRSALSELVSSIEIDMGDVERRLMELQSGAMEGLDQMTSKDLLPVVQTDRHRAALDRLRAFFSVFEGYASHASAAVGTTIVPGYAKIDEGMARHAAASSDGKQALEALLGITLDRSLTVAGTTFCAAVTKMRGIEALNQVWAAPDNLPTAAEIRDPFAWMERVIDA